MWVNFENENGVVSFNVEANAGKSLKDFSEHEKHHGFSEKKIKEIHDTIQKAAGVGKKTKGEAPAPVIGQE